MPRSFPSLLAWDRQQVALLAILRFSPLKSIVLLHPQNHFTFCLYPFGERSLEEACAYMDMHLQPLGRSSWNRIYFVQQLRWSLGMWWLCLASFQSWLEGLSRYQYLPAFTLLETSRGYICISCPSRKHQLWNTNILFFCSRLTRNLQIRTSILKLVNLLSPSLVFLISTTLLNRLAIREFYSCFFFFSAFSTYAALT